MKTKTYLKLWLVMAILACAALSVITPASQPVHAAGPWYVAPGGSDTNTCIAPSAACATINGALNKPGFVAGDTIRVATGVYTDAGDQVVLLNKSVTLSGGWNTGFTAQSGMSTIDGQGARLGVWVGGSDSPIVVIERFAVQNGTRGIYNANTLTLNNSTVSSNRAWNGAGIFNQNGTLTLNNSTVSGNTAEGPSSPYGYGGGIFNTSSTLTLNNSTVSDNIAYEDGGGIYSDYSLVTLNSSTVSNNAAMGTAWGWREGGGIYSFSDARLVLQNTVLAGNRAFNGADCATGLPAYTISSAGYNLIGDISGCAIGLTTGDLTNVDPKLGQWEGSPGYRPLLSGSPAINAGNPAGCMGSAGPLTTDQRGAPRVARCDIGSYEAGLTAAKQATGNYAPGESLTYTVSLRSDANSPIAGARVTDVLPVSLTYVPGSFSATTGTGGQSGGVITWTGTIPAAGSATISFRATIRDDMPSCSVITNKATIGGPGYEFERQVTGATPCVCNLTKNPGNPVLYIGTDGTWDDDAVWSPAVLKVGSSYKLWYTGEDGSTPSQIGLATSTDGTIWTKEAANPVLSPSQTWEVEGISAASIISDSGLYKMWYTGRDSGGVSRIGYATSTDGVNWTPYGSNPVLDVGPAGGWEDDDVQKPTVFKEGSTYHIWYTGNDGMTLRIGHATSSDGINWIKDSANPVLDIGSPGTWDWLNVYGPSVVKVGADYQLWYSGETLPEAWQTGYAMSSDGSTWTRGKMLIPEGSSGAFDAASADYPSVMVDGDKFKVWYSGLNNSGHYTVGYATAEICSGAGVPPSHPIYLPLVVKSTGNSCLAYYTDNFSDPTSGWPVDDDSNRRYAYTDGQYQIWVKEPSAGWWATPGAKATDFTASVSARRTSGALGAYGIRFGISEAPGSQFYEFIVEDTKYSIWRYDNDSGSWTALRDWTASSHINTGTNWNRLKVVRNGASIAVYVNNQLLATVSDSNFTGLGRIGLVAYSPDNSGLDARFDDFSLYPASCGAGAARAAGVGFEMGEPGGYEAPVPPGLGQLR